MNDQQIIDSFSTLYGKDADFQWLIDNRPLLAHYTSIQVLEKIMKNEELWLSNPLFMNDLEELRFGMQQGMSLFQQSEAVDKACRSSMRAHIVRSAFSHYFSKFDIEHALDVYVFCLSRHDPKNTNGLLSMWRGYGGHGNGAALVFNTDFITRKADSPLILAKVNYASAEKRTSILKKRLRQWCNILKANHIPDDKLYLAAYQFFGLIKIFALTYKHDGFREEREWRIIYMPDRDPQALLKRRFDYAIGSRGVEPKLKFKIEPLPIDSVETWTFATILERIILGPSVSSPLAKNSVVRMLETIGKAEFRQKVFPSSIPLRPT